MIKTAELEKKIAQELKKTEEKPKVIFSDLVQPKASADASSRLGSLIASTLSMFADGGGDDFFTWQTADKTTQKIKTIVQEFNGRNIVFYGVNQADQEQLDFQGFKEVIMKNMGFGNKNKTLVQLVGDSNQFSEAGTVEAKSFVKNYFDGNQMLEYGFTGYLTEDRKQLDVNSLLNDYVEENPDQSNRVLGNVLGHSAVALQKWGCKVTDKVSHFVLVYNQYGMENGFTKFGDDVMTSDHIMNFKDGDCLVMLEGGAQSFKQAINVLEKNIPVKALLGIRKPENRKFFSASEFFYCVTQETAKKGSDLTPQEVRDVLDVYLKTHKAWDETRPDADTKEKLFYSTVNEFIDQEIYKKLTTQVEITVTADYQSEYGLNKAAVIKPSSL